LLSASIDGRERIFWLAVDLPLVEPPFLTSLVAGLDRADVVMARTDRGLEPLCAAFRTEPVLVCVKRALLAGRLKLTSALEGLTMQAVDASAADFINVNTAAEYEHVSPR
jgi:molybdopterin-guanine dinucleotide biosynthesis protein A